MTIFTQGPVIRPTRNLLNDVGVGQIDAAKAAAEDAWIRSPTSSSRRNVELLRAEQGDLIRPGYPAYGVPEVRRDPETPLLDAATARQRVQDSGLPLTVPEEGIREGVLDILMERKKEELQRQFVLENAPTSTVPLQILAGFAASAADPINVASAFVPVYGQARYAAALANASSRTARLGVRAKVGAIQGAAGAALVEPIVLSAAQREQADYGITESLSNIAFGAALGGGLHALGGAISDFRANRLAQSSIDETPVPDLATTPDPVEPVPRNRTVLNRAATADDPVPSMGELMRRQIEADRPVLREQAVRQAREELLPTLRQEVEGIAAGRLPNVRELRTEQQSVQQQIEQLDNTFRDRAKRFQREESMSRKQAESAARREITAEREQLITRSTELSEQLDVNRQSELARADINRIARGEVPEQFNTRVQQRADEIANRFSFTGTARAVAEAAPWPVRQAALRSAVAQMATGRQVNVDPVFAMNDRATRSAAITQLKDGLKDPMQGRLDQEGVQASQAAEERSTLPDGTDLESAQRMLDEELAMTQELADQAGIDLQPSMKVANDLADDARIYAAAIRAAAICRLRT